MAPNSPPSGYSLSQILLHWLIAILVIFQILFGEGMEHAFDAKIEHKPVDSSDALGANIHLYVGIAIFVLAVLRLIVRAKNGVPPAPPGTSGVKKAIAAGTQHLLYLVILLMPVSGAVAWFGGIEIVGTVHKVGEPLIVLLVLLHVLGALVQHFIAKTNVLVRMLRPAS
jgi:cytochrome b561